MIRRLSIIMMLILIPGLAYGGTYYVSNHGNNSYSGIDTTHEWLTLGHACSTLVANDTLLIMGGTWRESHATPGWGESGAHGTLVPINSGTPGHPIVYKAHSAYPRPIITTVGADYSSYGILIFNHYIHDIVFDSLVQKKTSRGIASWGISSYITIKNCVIDSTGGVSRDSNNGGIILLGLEEYKDYWTIQACSSFANYETFDSTWVNHAGMLFYYLRNSTITGNFVFNEPGGSCDGGIFLKQTNSHNTISNNIIHDIGARGITAFYDCDSNTIRNNIIYNCGDGINLEPGTLNHGTRPQYTNIGNSVYNNTIYNVGNGIYSRYAAGEDEPLITPQIFNNIVLQSSYGFTKPTARIVQNLYGNFNCYWNSGSSNFASWNGTAYNLPNFIANIHYDSNSVNVNPLFADPVNHDFHLTAGSPSAVKTGGRGGAYPTYMGALAPNLVTYTISGTVTLAGNGLAGVAINGLPGNPTTNGSGNYTATIDSNWSGTATPVLNGYTFSPASRSYSGVNSNSSGQNYIALPDTTPPTLSNVGSGNITDHAATINWNTNELATSQVNYGLTTGYDSTTALNPSLTLSHSVNLSGLIADTIYHFRVRSKDASNNEAVSIDYQFHTDTSVAYTDLAIGITPTVDSSYAGYSIARINDSVVNPRGGTLTTWASAESALLPHWVQFNFGRRVSVMGLKIYWAWNSSYWMCSRQYRIQYWNETTGAFADIDTVNNSVVDSTSTTWFEPRVTSRIRYYQTPNMGPTSYPTVIWLTEMEIYGTEAGQDTTAPSAPSNYRGQPYNGHGSIELHWNAPGDDSTSGTATAYLIKYMPDTGSAFDWNMASFFNGSIPAPAPADSPQVCIVDGLTPGERYFVAIRAYDEVGNASPEAVIDTFSSGIIVPEQIRTLIDTTAHAATVVASLVESYRNIFYEFALDSVYSFPNPRLEQELSADTVADFIFDSLSQRTTYYWKCRAKSNDGPDSSGWSPVISFNLMTTDINQPLTSADCIAPIAGAQIVSNRPTFTVRYISGLAIVYFEVDSSIDFSSPIQSGPIFADGISPISWRPTNPLDKNGSFYWRASSDNMLWTAPIAFSAVLDIHAYPIPFRASEGLPGITFTNLPEKSKITIATVSGDVVRNVADIGPLEWVWDVRNDKGRQLASGVYLYVVDYGGGTTQGKIVVIR